MRNSAEFLPLEEIMRRSGLQQPIVRNKLKKFLRIGVIKRKKIALKQAIPPILKKNKVLKFRIRKVVVYFANSDFELFQELRFLFTRASLASKQRIIKKIKSLGKGIKLAVIAGIFLNNDNCRTDLLVVGNGIKRGRFERFLGGVEADLGKPVRYTLMDTKEFSYRLDMYDKLQYRNRTYALCNVCPVTNFGHYRD
ncbi:MAG: hypothetical protein UX07_C0051G0005 [Parcubacteria group bacterium GW2011_GWA2_45_30]|nr:MAG: hypothetical protein UX07_C0051G0005 [Parcubacteria group bacterium GW2011_GWA2_45_30]